MIEDVEDPHQAWSRIVRPVAGPVRTPPLPRQGLTRRQPDRARHRLAATGDEAMIDTFALALAHGLLALTAWRLFRRPDLDRDDDVAIKTVWGKRPDA